MRTRPNVMRFFHVAAVLALFTCFGCAAREPRALATPPSPAPPPTPASAPPPASAEAPSTVVEKVASTRVVVTGILLRRDDGIEVCPGQWVDACPGIRVEGKVEDAWISARGKLSVWRLSGRFDGTTLVLDGPAQPTTLTQEASYRNSCPEHQKLRKGVNPDLDSLEKVQAFMREHAERVAGHWWDQARQTLVVSVTGDPTELRQRFAERAPGARVCIQGQARFSEAPLESLRVKADAILRKHGVVWSSSGGDVVKNDVLFEVEAIDAKTRAELTREAGDAIRVQAFIELLEHDLAQMPAPPKRGDVALVTSTWRSGGGMSALGRFSVHYDAELRCVYFNASGERVLPVWPFGYWAATNPLRIYDYDDKIVVQEGETIELGGGQVDIEHVRADNPCGAKQAWIGRREATGGAAR
jgi:hypothetical protein